MLRSGNTADVDGVLARHGLGEFDWPTAIEMSGRNHSWTGDTSLGHRFFVKALTGSDDEVRSILSRTDAFYRLSACESIPTSALIAQDDVGVQIYTALDGAADGRRLAVDGDFDTTVAAEAGALVAAVHESAPTRIDELGELERTAPRPTGRELLDGLTLDLFHGCSGGQLEAWRILQGDPDVAAALALLESAPVCTPVHGDLALDQFVRSAGRLHIVDWEGYGAGDPAQDVGTFAGEWLHRCVTTFLADRARHHEGGPAAAPTIALTPRWRPWLADRPVVEAFWASYRRRAPDSGLRLRATMFAGWQLLMRMHSDAAMRTRLDGSGHTLHRLARLLLGDPARFAPVLGLSA